jgi:hypothetical protein
MKTEAEFRKAMIELTRRGFIGHSQRMAISEGIQSEEAQYFIDKVCGIFDAIQAMPKTYDQDGLGDNAVVHLHYFIGGCDWYITEKDMEDDQWQAFGYADLGYGGELGYISLIEITRARAEIDFHWAPVTLAAVKAKVAA